ncbi:MAG: TetR/AcrR family transcriptional regulator [Acholeplasmatales bacterium]|nr:TetR/AcrR family transcriptional regulator [Acholeplasmatales bacterium]
MDKRYEKKELLMKETFKELLSNKYYEDITVQELTNKAKIDRKTFYLHYNTLDDLLKSIQNDLANKFNERVKGLDSLNDLEKVTK